MLRSLWLLALAAVVLLLPACSDDVDVAEELNIDRDGFTAYFDLTASVLPFPNNLLFSGTADGTLNIPVADETDISDPKVAMNALDGFSTIAPISTTFSGTIDPATLTPETVRVFEVSLSGIGGVVTGINRELGFGQEFVATLSSVDPGGSTLVILPTAPLSPLTSYLVMLTDGIKGASGADPQISAHYLIAKTPNDLTGTAAEALEPVRKLVNYQEAALAGQGIDTGSVILSWTFTTQSVGAVLGAVHATTPTGSAAIFAPAGTTKDILGEASPGDANIYLGNLEVPYYLTAAADTHDTAPLGTWWQGLGGSNLSFLNPHPVATSTETVPLLLSVPAALDGSGDPLPVVIFQHGITSDRTALLGAADALAAAGFAAVAIDMPLHGLPPGHPLRNDLIAPERTFDLDLANNETGAPGPDGVTDSSGTHYINLASLLTSRDNLRQSVADLFQLKAALETFDYNGGGPDFDTDAIYYVGHSLGGMVGSVFLALEPDINAAVLGMPGGGIAKLLDGSASFGPRIAAGLAVKGVLKGSADYESFLGATQTVIDSADPLNYAGATAEERGVLMFEVLGDLVVPNNVFADAPAGTVPSPLAGTDPLAFFMGLTPVSETTMGSHLAAVVRFDSGDHSSLLLPTADPAVWSAMQKAMATFLASDGALIDLGE
ncbi:MAG: Ig-like domain-containing protein [Desulfuromonadales bacterium]|nr:Ig-like domain-containing protein [Desulfuromonadales bacterium]